MFGAICCIGLLMFGYQIFDAVSNTDWKKITMKEIGMKVSIIGFCVYFPTALTSAMSYLRAPIYGTSGDAYFYRFIISSILICVLFGFYKLFDLTNNKIVNVLLALVLMPLTVVGIALLNLL